ncbi:YciI family protein [Mucilaginibacter panaciglaebae]|uniref:YCII-related domain-containing protein n=1 Tax=Mucilaginibacter panaciglaebae TaxID=502331 RepID=A0ABP7WG35_9SPHI
MKEYMLIFRHQDGSKIASPEQMQKWMQATMDWLNSIADKGKYDGKGDGLVFDNAKVVHHGGVVTNGPFGEIKETLGGYVIVKADSIDEAAEFAKGSPILGGDGNTVEVRLLAKGDGVH